jgi:cytochrome c-type biogenesis protein CcmH/NrfG
LVNRPRHFHHLADGHVSLDLCLFFADRAVTAMEENRRPRFRFRLRTILLVVAILALFLTVVIQQVQIGRQHVQIKQMSQQIDGYSKETARLRTKFRTIMRWRW